MILSSGISGEKRTPWSGVQVATAAGRLGHYCRENPRPVQLFGQVNPALSSDLTKKKPN